MEGLIVKKGYRTCGWGGGGRLVRRVTGLWFVEGQIKMGNRTCGLWRGRLLRRVTRLVVSGGVDC